MKRGDVYPVDYGYMVRFGRKISKFFKSKEKAYAFLDKLRYEYNEDMLDVRDYMASQPLGFSTLAENWLTLKRKQLKPKSWQNLNRVMTRASKAWGNENIKFIREGQIEDFIFSGDMASKTRNDVRVVLQEFWKWVCRRDKKVTMPEFPKTPYEMDWRGIIDIPTQQRILNELWEISSRNNIKIWIGVRFLSIYISMRPAELLNIRERYINLDAGFLLIPHPKEKNPKIVYLLDDDIKYLKSIPKGLPDLYFFRHNRSVTSVKAGQKFGESYLRRWWKRACKNLGIEGVDLYGGTRHSTVTALGKICTPEEVKDATGHVSPAFERYFQSKQARALKVTEKIQHLNNGSKTLNVCNLMDKS